MSIAITFLAIILSLLIGRAVHAARHVPKYQRPL